jgi:hypothetical protein
LNFPQGNPEKTRITQTQDRSGILLPTLQTQLHQNSIFDLIWLDDGVGNLLATASGDQNGVIFDAEAGTIVSQFGSNHQASLKSVT